MSEAVEVATDRPAVPPARGKGGAALVALGIFLSRLLGLVRTRALTHFLGVGPVADAFNAAFRIPNFLQNLFGEGVLSASFIPVYAGLLGRGDEAEADRVAGAVAALLSLTVAVLVALGMLFTPSIVDVVAAGFTAETRDLTVRLVRISFPATGLLVLSAWCLGVLNSHRRFFLSYAAPVAWNVAIIAALLGWGPRVGDYELAIIAMWGALVGSALQLLVQLPAVLSLLGRLRLQLATRDPNVRTVTRNFAPVALARGVVQVSAYIDIVLASWLPVGAVAVLSYAQVLYMLPVSLFGMAVSAAELPAMSSARGAGGVGDETQAFLRRRLDAGLRQIAFFVVPSAIAFLALGDLVVAAIYRSGEFGLAAVLWTWGALAGAAVGLLAITMARLYSSTYYALHDTRTPLRYAVVRVVLTVVLGYLFAFPLPRALGIEPRWGVVGLTIAGGIVGWVELALLRRTLNGRIGRTGLPAAFLARLGVAAVAAAAVGWAVRLVAPLELGIWLALLALGAYGLAYLGLTALMGVPEVRTALARLRGRFGGRR